MKRLRYLLPLIIVAVLGGFMMIGLSLDPRRVPSPLVDQPAPRFQLPALEDPERVVGSNDFDGEVVLLNIWASWCVSCRQEHQVLVALANQGVPIYGLNYKDERGDGLAYLRSMSNPYVWNAHDLEGRVGIDWGVYGTPETFVIDHQGRIRYKHVGPLSWQDARDTVLPMVEQLRREAL
ncbi:DsbE family thiol:disulfide interchange protein [Ectothiorhodospira lacustris]|uniref:DsbE family thiol:disulfide interchange protein n=1 Tax=Ectothiorhodospira lacustris TaxID=2899127 RepID=UPI001EE9A04C|nr:DsbE family thiol:disulfide interchange protein [Ectothiorhodospira lacustris]MCG5499860.1 DsbE family thiol:disulfide interchange protein [Ectothiorhodospira lacustris]MCG5509008.1 DsbE family thiol:disulfide interchange protein [Ectothiorhodospira lacustris]MCG5520799.1 DsbE family thiol:disulfide interchange protein [Ectothiorhodospira lacustris]